MLQGNAKDYFISINLSNIDIWMGESVVWIDWVKTYNMQLPHNCVDEDFQSEFWQESNETLETHNPDTYFVVG
ncbi:hypothetical protein Lser_V15G37349 [Lactuca serriola]